MSRKQIGGWLAVGVIAAIGLYAYAMTWQRREAAYSTMKAIYSALCLYEDKHGALPTVISGDDPRPPSHSWRVTILETIEESPSANEAAADYSIERAWDSPENQRALQKWLKSNEQLAQAAHYVRFRAVYDEAHPFWGKPFRDAQAPSRTPIVVMLPKSDPERWCGPDLIVRRGNSFVLIDGMGSEETTDIEGLLTLFGDSSVRPFHRATEMKD